MVMNEQSRVVTQIQAIDRHDSLSPYLASHAELFFSGPEPSPFSLKEVSEWSRSANLDLATSEAVEGMARKVRADRLLSFLFFHCGKLAFDCIRLYPGDKIRQWPSFAAFLPDSANLFLLLIALSAIPRIRRIHQVLQIPDRVSRESCADIASRVKISREFRNGEIGVSETCINWLRHHVKGDLFQLGRLQFHPIIFDEPVRVYRHLENHRVLILAEPGQRFTGAGLYDGAGQVFNHDSWVSDWHQEQGMITATSFNQAGRAERRPVTIDAGQWRLVLDGSSSVLNIHIPRGDKITVADWYDSMRRGLAFFQRYRPIAAPASACACKSWMFDPVLQDLLPASSGLVSIQRRVNLFPRCSADDRNGFSFIFGSAGRDLDHAPRDTSLRRALIEHVRRGGTMSGGVMLVFADQLEE